MCERWVLRASVLMSLIQLVYNVAAFVAKSRDSSAGGNAAKPYNFCLQHRPRAGVFFKKKVMPRNDDDGNITIQRYVVYCTSVGPHCTIHVVICSTVIKKERREGKEY